MLSGGFPMKKNIGSKLALYPMPITVVGAMNGDQPTWTLVGHLGIIGHDRVLVSLAAPPLYQRKDQRNKKALYQSCGRGYFAPGGLCRFRQRQSGGQIECVLL